MSKSVKGKPHVKRASRNPIQSASPYETTAVGEDCAPNGPSLKQAPTVDPVADADSGAGED